MMLKSTNYDVVILGSGPAGLQAAVHAARKKVDVLLLGKETKSSLFHAHIENFCCLFNVKGEDLLNVGRQQAINFGAVMLEEDVLQAVPAETGFKVVAESGQALQTKSLIIATGTTRNKLGVAGEKELLGRGVSYCVECDANFYKDEDVAVVGGASAAVSGALTLLNYAASVHLVCDKLEVTDALKRLLQDSAVVIHEGRQVQQIAGESKVEGLIFKDGGSLPVSGVFIELGAKGLMELATHLGVQLDDEMKYIQTNKKMETNVPGVFAAGDICGPPWQMAKAVGEGCVAGIGAANYAKRLAKAA
ncbi:MAG: FAD-dependent oxidoreductase [Desulfobacterales bacterium]|jgi:thioredoxin reductase (NADPH)